MRSTCWPSVLRVALGACVSILVGAGCATGGEGGKGAGGLGRGLVFHASFDRGIDADLGGGNREIRTALADKTDQRGLPAGGWVVPAEREGRFGGALRFLRKSSEYVFYAGRGNMPYRGRDWSGTVSVWLKVDPAKELAPGFCDPVQITSKDWNDAAFFVEFEKKTNGIPFRLGVYPDLPVWNPGKRPWESILAEEKPLVGVGQHPFLSGEWTHAVFTFERFNTGRPDGVARLYLNGELYAVMPPREQAFTWDQAQLRIKLGVAYVGLLDEVAIFDRALSEAEVRALHALPRGVADLR